jgi:predicted transcriptional regulator
MSRTSKTNAPNDVKSKFSSGEFTDVCELFDTHPALKSSKELLPFWLGALVFTGELDKAQVLFQKSSLTPDQKIAGRFYLSVGLIRQSRYADARALLGENLRLKGKVKSKESLFYIFQGLAFYRFFCGQFFQSNRYAHSAFQAAVEAEFVFGEMISKDLLAHSLIQLGQVRKGLKYFEDTLKIARRVSNQWLTAAVEISILKFRAQFGLDSKTDLLQLQKALSELNPQDTYSISELLLEVIRQQLLRGNFSAAETVLAQASDIVYKHQNRRQIALLNFRMSYMLYLQAQNTQALHVIRFAEQNIDRKIDLSLFMQIQGLKQSILRAAGKESEAQNLQDELSHLREKNQIAINHKILARAPKSNVLNKFSPGEDPLGDLLDKIAKQDEQAPKLIVENKYYGLLHKYYKLPFGTQALIFDLMPGSIVILDKGNVIYQQKGLNTLIRKILLLIRHEPQNKEQLVNGIWGYEYDPQRHDPLIYSSINKIRKLLGPYGDWIVLTENGYQIHRDVKVIFRNTLKKQITVAPSLFPSEAKKDPTAPRKKIWDENLKNLNFRQLQIVDFLKRHSSLSISELSEKLEISKPTATRDLSQLYNVGILKRAGRGRATRYFIRTP